MTENQGNKRFDVAGRFRKIESLNESAAIEENSEFGHTQLLHELRINCEKALAVTGSECNRNDELLQELQVHQDRKSVV